jgi:cytochrome c553
VSIRAFILATLVALLAARAADAQMLQPLSLQGDAERGKGLAYTCTGCHGVDGAVNAYPTYHVPKLGGQNADYIEVALQGYRAGTRAHATMHAQAAELSDQDIADLAAYFGSLEGTPATGISAASAAEIAAGQEKSQTCQACHGVAGLAPAQQWPNLAGQHASYLLHAMQQYQRGDRSDPTMAGLVAPLDEQTLEEIAAFFASQAGLFQSPH